MVFVYLLFSALAAWVALGDGAELLSEDLLPLLLPQIDHRPARVRQVTGVVWVVFSVIGVWRGWL